MRGGVDNLVKDPEKTSIALLGVLAGAIDSVDDLDLIG